MVHTSESQLAGLPKLRANLDRAFRAFRANPSVSNRLNMDTALSVYQIALARKTSNGANLHHVSHETMGITSAV